MFDQYFFKNEGPLSDHDVSSDVRCSIIPRDPKIIPRDPKKSSGAPKIVTRDP